VMGHGHRVNRSRGTRASLRLSVIPIANRLSSTIHASESVEGRKVGWVAVARSGLRALRASGGAGNAPPPYTPRALA
jgi:hypothetical protein